MTSHSWKLFLYIQQSMQACNRQPSTQPVRNLFWPTPWDLGTLSCSQWTEKNRMQEFLRRLSWAKPEHVHCFPTYLLTRTNPWPHPTVREAWNWGPAVPFRARAQIWLAPRHLCWEGLSTSTGVSGQLNYSLCAVGVVCWFQRFLGLASETIPRTQLLEDSALNT